jgi:hypothetical protein
MHSSGEPIAPAAAETAPSGFPRWNRRLHFHGGLYFLFFTWLFALTGLLLNHSAWEFARFWPDRKVTTSEHALRSPPATASLLEAARDVCRQIGLEGEIEWVTNRPDAQRLEFRVNRPGVQVEIKTDFASGRATVRRTAVNAWGIAHHLHSFTGVRVNDPRRNQRDWIVTTAWALAMDAVAIGLLVVVASGIVMWWCGGGQRRGGAIALGLGTALCAFLVFGLRWWS